MRSVVTWARPAKGSSRYSARPGVVARIGRGTGPLTVLVALIAAASPAAGQSLVDTNLGVRPVVSGLATPTTMAFLGPNDFFVLEKATGKVRWTFDRDGDMLPTDGQCATPVTTSTTTESSTTTSETTTTTESSTTTTSAAHAPKKKHG